MIDFQKCVSLEQVSLRLNVPLSCEILYTVVAMWLVKSPKVVKGEGWLKALILAILREVLHVRILVLDLTDVLEDNLQILCLMLRGNNKRPFPVMSRGINDVLHAHMMRLREIPLVVIPH